MGQHMSAFMKSDFIESIKHNPVKITINEKAPENKVEATPENKKEATPENKEGSPPDIY
jgi:hypothetical protein